MKLIKMSLAAALAASLAFGADAKSDLGVSANMSIVSDYIWRGMTQSDNSPAIQGGFDLEYKGLYAGVWGSNIEFGDDSRASAEFDIYGGYTNELYGISYDLGAIQYAYPNESKELNFAEAYFGLSKDFEIVKVGAKYYHGIKTDQFDAPNAWEATLSVPLPMDINLDALYGDYNDIGNYYSVGVTKSIDKFEVALSYTGIEADADNSDQDNIVVRVGVNF